MQPIRSMRQQVAGAYLAGTNTRRVRRALAALFKGAILNESEAAWRAILDDLHGRGHRANSSPFRVMRSDSACITLYSLSPEDGRSGAIFARPRLHSPRVSCCSPARINALFHRLGTPQGALSRRSMTCCGTTIISLRAEADGLSLEDVEQFVVVAQTTLRGGPEASPASAHNAGLSPEHPRTPWPIGPIASSPSTRRRPALGTSKGAPRASLYELPPPPGTLTSWPRLAADLVR